MTAPTLDMVDSGDICSAYKDVTARVLTPLPPATQNVLDQLALQFQTSFTSMAGWQVNSYPH